MLILVTATLAVFLPKVERVFGFAGGVFCSFVVFIVPALMKLTVGDHGGDPPTTAERWFCYGLIVFGGLLLISEIYQIVWDNVS